MVSMETEQNIYDLQNRGKVTDKRGCCCQCICSSFSIIIALICTILSAVTSILFTTQIDLGSIEDKNPTGIDTTDELTIATIVLIIGGINLLIRIIQYFYWYKKVGQGFDSESVAKSRDAIFIAYTAFSDIMFDIIQGLALYFIGSEYDVTLFVITGTWIGFGEEIINFSVEIITIFQDSCADCIYSLWVFTLILSIIIEQGLGIYIGLNEFNDIQILQYIALSLNGIVILVGIIFVLRFCKGGCKYMQ